MGVPKNLFVMRTNRERRTEREQTRIKTTHVKPLPFQSQINSFVSISFTRAPSPFFASLILRIRPHGAIATRHRIRDSRLIRKPLFQLFYTVTVRPYFLPFGYTIENRGVAPSFQFTIRRDSSTDFAIAVSLQVSVACAMWQAPILTDTVNMFNPIFTFPLRPI